MRKYHWLKRRRPASYLISEYSSQSKLEDRYTQGCGIHFIPPSAKLEDLLEPLEEKVEVRVDCQVSVEGVSCGVEIGEGDVEAVSGNEPTKLLKNMKKAIHRRFSVWESQNP